MKNKKEIKICRKKIYKTKEGKQILKFNLEKMSEDFKNETGWFSKEEDEYWRKFREQE